MALKNKRITHVSREGNNTVILYDDDSTRTKLYDNDDYRSLLKDAILYHKERIVTHTREGNSLLKEFEKANNRGGA